jgi:hypothetical protein
VKDTVRRSDLVPAETIRGHDGAETRRLRRMLADAEAYLTSHDWCPEIAGRSFAYGVGVVVAVFLFDLARRIRGKDRALWVVVGDLPSAYLVTDRIPDAHGALASYCDLMQDWIAAVRRKRGLAEAFPVDAEATPVNADHLSDRIQFLRKEILPTLRGGRGASRRRSAPS